MYTYNNNFQEKISGKRIRKEKFEIKTKDKFTKFLKESFRFQKKSLKKDFVIAV